MVVEAASGLSLDIIARVGVGWVLYWPLRSPFIPPERAYSKGSTKMRTGNEKSILVLCFAVVIALALGVRIGFTQAGVDWKVYGGVSVDGASLCFYDANGVVPEPGNQIRVWTKCLPLKALDNIVLTDKMMEDAAQKILDGYVPPIVVVGEMKDRIPNIVAYEEKANLDSVKPQSRIFYEIDCSEQMIHELSVYIDAKGKVASSNKTADWQHVPPETNGALLLKILCPK